MARSLLINIFLLTFIVACVYADECRNKCGQNETCNSCGNQCELNCSDIHKNICPLICNSAACACDPEYARDNLTGKCIHKLQCPQYK
ncbi:serine protease inhibitor 1-like [Cotesia typhae]